MASSGAKEGFLASNLIHSYCRSVGKCRGRRDEAAKFGMMITVTLLLGSIIPSVEGQFACGKQAGGARCQLGVCCSQFGYCGSTPAHCGKGCQNQCNGLHPPPCPARASPAGKPKIRDVIPSKLFDTLFPSRNAFYTYKSFITAAESFPGFGTTGGATTAKREIAAFFAHVNQETTGLVYINEIDRSGTYCDPDNKMYPCASGAEYFGRGPLQLSWNFNYGAAGAALHQPLLRHPNLLSTNATLAFQASIWFWQTASGKKPACHAAMTGKWKPSKEDIAEGRHAGFGATTNIINGGIECGKSSESEKNRVKYFLTMSKYFCVQPGANLSCDQMQPFR